MQYRTNPHGYRASKDKPMINFNLLRVDRVNWHDGCFEVYYRVFPYWFSRVSVYQIEEIIQFLNDMQNGEDPKEKTVSTEFLLEEWESMVEMDIELFHYTEMGMQLISENNRLISIINALQKRVSYLTNKLKTKVKLL
jgi:hypothetical protein